MAFARPERDGEMGESGTWRAPRRSRWTGRPVRIGALDHGAGVDGAEADASPDRVVLLRFEWRTSRDEVQPVLLALPELLD